MGNAIIAINQNAVAAAREYAERFPERHHLGPRQFINLV
jgi:hypothetical protein